MLNLICPVCSLTLSDTADGKSVHCKNGHLFDKARQGYINLLLSNQKKSKNPGDTQEMVVARTRFLEKAYYSGIVDRLIQYANQQLPKSNNTINYCDIACGEGYYTQKISESLAKKKSAVCTGFDISTPAVKAAARREKHIQWLIASASSIPLLSKSQDFITCLFCRVDYEAAARIAKPGALFIVAETGPSHLIELREKVYDRIDEVRSKIEPANTSNFRLLTTETYTSPVKLTNTQDILDLLTMTPHFWRVKPEKKMELETLTTLDVTLDIRFHVFIAQD